MRVSVTVVPDRTKSGAGEIDPAMPWADIRADIVDTLGLGDNPEEWTIALCPKDLTMVPKRYHLTDGDTLLLIKRDVTRQRAFTPH